MCCASQVQLETNYKEEYVQSASLVRTQTDVMAELIENSAVEVAETAVATAELLIATSEYSALETVEVSFVARAAAAADDDGRNDVTARGANPRARRRVRRRRRARGFATRRLRVDAAEDRSGVSSRRR